MLKKLIGLRHTYLFGVMLFLGLLMVPQPANAANIFYFAIGKIIGFVVFAITYITAYIAGMLFTFAGLFLNFGLKLNGALLQSPTVLTGWVIVRDLTNLMFVLGIIFIAIATTLRISKYGMKQILWRLLVAAILVNFSLTIAGVIIDASGLVTNFFIAKILPTPGQGNTSVSLSTALAHAFGVQRALDASNNNFGNYENATEFGKTMIQLLANMIFSLIFTAAGATLMFIVAALVFVRYVYLTILLILMPLAWLGWIFPGSRFSEAYNMWWGKFLEWNIWLPVASFFIYLTVLLVANQENDAGSIGKIAENIQRSPDGNSLEGFVSFTAGAFATFGQMAAIMGLLAGGMMAAGKISDHGAKTAIHLVEKGGNWTKGMLKTGTQKATLGLGGVAIRNFLRAGARPAQFDPRTGGLIKGERKAYGQRLATGLARLGLVGAASAVSGTIETGKASVDNYRTKYLDKLSKEAVVAVTKSKRPMTDTAKAALAIKLAKENALGDISSDQLGYLVDSVQKMNVTKDFAGYLDKISKETAISMATSPYLKTDDLKASLAIKLAKENALGDISSTQLDDFIGAVKRTNLTKDFLERRVDLAPKFGKTTTEVLKKITNISSIAKDALKQKEVVLGLSNSQFKSFGSHPDISEEVKDVIRNRVKEDLKRIKELNAKISANTATADEKTEIKGLDKDRERLAIIYKLTHNTPSWSIKELKR